MQAQRQSPSNRFLTFRVGGQLYALSSEEVLEVIRVPAVARVPQGPPALLGIANLRGTVLPIALLHRLLGKPLSSLDGSTARAIVLDLGAPIAIVVDSVAALESAHEEQIDARPKELGADASERLLGAFSIGPDKNVAKILDIKALLEDAFAIRGRSARQAVKFNAATRTREASGGAEETETLVTFDVAGQEFALPLEDVQEIISAPEGVTALAHCETVVLGLASVRGALLPLLSLRTLLGFSSAETGSERQKVLIVRVGGTRVGLVADRARAIVAAETRLVDPLPPALTARAACETRIRSV